MTSFGDRTWRAFALGALGLSVLALFIAFGRAGTPCAEAAAGTCPVADTRTIARGLIVNNDSVATSAGALQAKGGTDANALYVDPTTDRVGIGTGTPATKFDIVGAAQVSGLLSANSSLGIGTSQTTFPLVNATSTTVNFAGAATSIVMGATTGTVTINNPNVAFPANTTIYRNSTSGLLTFSGGTGSPGRVSVYGTAHATAPGYVQIIPGNIAGSKIEFYQADGATVAAQILASSGAFTINNGLSLANSNLTAVGNANSSWTATALTSAAGVPLRINDTTAATSATTGSGTFAGGVGVNGNVFGVGRLEADNAIAGTLGLVSSTVLMAKNSRGATNDLTQIGIGSYNVNVPVVVGSVMTNGASYGTADFFIATRSATTDTAPSERFRITGGGNVGIGNTAPGSLLDLGTAGSIGGIVRFAGVTSGYVSVKSQSAAGTWTMQWPAAVGTAGYQLTDAAGDGLTSWAAAGSRREYKTDIVPVVTPQDALDTLLHTPVYNFHYLPGVGTGDTVTQYTGVIADEAPWAMHYGGGVLNPVNALGYTILGFQAQQARIDNLEARLAALEAKK